MKKKVLLIVGILFAWSLGFTAPAPKLKKLTPDFKAGLNKGLLTDFSYTQMLGAMFDQKVKLAMKIRHKKDRVVVVLLHNTSTFQESPYMICAAAFRIGARVEGNFKYVEVLYKNLHLIAERTKLKDFYSKLYSNNPGLSQQLLISQKFTDLILNYVK